MSPPAGCGPVVAHARGGNGARTGQSGWSLTTSGANLFVMSSASLPILRGERVTLRRPREEDFQARLRLGNNAEIYRMYGGSRSDLHPLTEEGAKRWVRRL